MSAETKSDALSSPEGLTYLVPMRIDREAQRLLFRPPMLLSCSARHEMGKMLDSIDALKEICKEFIRLWDKKKALNVEMYELVPELSCPILKERPGYISLHAFEAPIKGEPILHKVSPMNVPNPPSLSTKNFGWSYTSIPSVQGPHYMQLK